MRPCGKIVFRAAIWALWAFSCLAQEVRVSGRVVDENAAPVPAARLDFSSPLTSRPLPAAFTDEFGRFDVVLPRPGAYAIQAGKDGFFLLKDVQANFTGGVNRLTVTLNHLRELVETIDVVYSPPAIDPVETSERRQLTNMQILEVPFPASQDFRNALTMMPGVIKDRQGRLHFSGGSSAQTGYTLDGFNLADVYNGELEARISIDAIRSLDLESGRLSVEKGRGSAGALDIATGMGDDRLRFGATNFFPGISAERGLLISKWTPRITVSGPVSRGKAWFHNGFDAFYDVDTVRELPKGQDRSRNLTAGNLSRIQWNLTPANTLTASLLLNFSDTDHRGLSFLNPIEATLYQRRRLGMATVKDLLYLPNQVLLEFGFAFTRGRSSDSPQGENTYIISPYGFRGNHYNRYQRRTGREQWTLAGIAPLTARGVHELRAGIDLQRSGFEQDSARHDFRILREDGTLARWVWFQGNRRMEMSNLEASVYARDRWQIREGFVLSAGVRADWNQIVRQTLLSPRISASSSPAWLRGVKATIGFGIYNDVLNLELLTRRQDQRPFAAYYSRSGLLLQPPVETALLSDERSLRVPRFRVYSLSLERMLPGGIHLASAYSRRRGYDGLAFYGPSDGPPEALTAYTLANRRRDLYDAWETTLRNTFAGRFEWLVSYTYSLARSSAVVDISPENPLFGPQAAGPLNWDAPHRLLAWGWTPLPQSFGPGWMRRALRETGLAYLMEARSGFPFSVYNEEGSRVGSPNERRLPAHFSINLHAEKKLRLWGYLWALRAGYNNLTNHGNPNVVNNNVDSPFFLTYGGGERRATNVRLRFLGRK